MFALKITARADELLIEVQVAPRASRTKLLGVHDGKLKVALEAAPVDGEANAALIAFLAKLLKQPKRNVVLVRGETSRHKLVALRGVTEAELQQLLA
ncbi:MAG: DUF167 domain-containing protein [Myxococcales bacterium]